MSCRPYLFAETEPPAARRSKRAAAALTLIDLGIGDGRYSHPMRLIVEKLLEGASKPVNHRYPSSSGMAEFREAVASWYQEPLQRQAWILAKEVVSLIGSKEGHRQYGGWPSSTRATSYWYASPCYPVYHIGTAFNGGKNYSCR